MRKLLTFHLSRVALISDTDKAIVKLIYPFKTK